MPCGKPLQVTNPDGCSPSLVATECLRAWPGPLSITARRCATVEGSGSVAAAVAALLDVYPVWRVLVELEPDPFPGVVGAA